ncbi:MAG: hypothetical protein H7288_06125 [Kineosporiaceae bacterium]|nr:hypothetical protein [Aeromicrobium sp.]
MFFLRRKSTVSSADESDTPNVAAKTVRAERKAAAQAAKAEQKVAAQTAHDAVITARAAAVAAAQAVSDSMTTVSGVGRHQKILGGLLGRVTVELVPWKRGESITVKLQGERVGEFSNGKLHTVLLAMMTAGLPLVNVPGEVRRGDWVPRYLAVATPDPKILKALHPELWAPGVQPVKMLPQKGIGVYRTGNYQPALRELYRPNARRREATVTFGVHTSGKFTGQRNATVELGGQVIGELIAQYSEGWELIVEDREVGVLGHLMVRVEIDRNGNDIDGPFIVDALYKRVVPVT